MRLRSSVSTAGSARAAQSANRMLGTVLAEEGFIQPSDIYAILSQQTKSGGLFGQTALDMGKISPEELDYALAKQIDSGVLPMGDESIDPLLVAAFDLNDPYAAKVRAVRSKILAHTAEVRSLDNRFCAIVGFGCEEETSILASNLAIVMVRMGTPAVAVDSTYNAPLLDQLFRLPNRSGMANLRADVRSSDIAQQSSIPNLWVIPTGPMPAETVATLERDLIKDKLSGWDIPQTQFVVSLSLKDDSTIAPAAQSLIGFDCVVLLARKHDTEIANLRTMIDLLDERQVPVAGVVIV